MTDSLTAEQRVAATTRGPVSVVAGAGSGKTLTMVHRFLTLVELGVEPTAIVAITFTRAAARELRYRIEQALEARSHPLAPTLVVAPITTFDGLAYHIARVYAGAHDLAPDVEIQDPRTAPVTRRIELGALLARALGDDPLPAPLALLEDLADLALTQPAEVASALSLDLARERERATEEVQAWWRTQRDALLAALEECSPRTDAQQRLVDQARAIGSAIDAFLRAGAADGSTLVEAVNAVRRGARGAAIEPLSELVTTLKLRLQDPEERARALGWTSADERIATAYPDLRELVERTRTRAFEHDRREGTASFASIEEAALRALGTDWVRADLRQRWRALIVDEYQDVSPAQATFVVELTELLGGETAIVGDPKQAIYGFRGARAHFIKAFATRSRVVELTRSFRSRAPVLELANDFAARALRDASQLTPQRVDPSGLTPITALTVVGGNVSDRRSAAASWVAERITTLLAEAHNALRPRDVAIVARRWADLEAYRRELARHGVNAVADGGGNLLATRAGLLVRSILRWLASPADDEAALALARSEAIGVSDRELRRLAETRGGIPWSVVLEALPDARGARLRALRRATQGLGATDALLRAIELLELDAISAGGPEPERRLADLHASVEFIASLPTGRTVTETAELLERLVDTAAPIARPPIPSLDAVRLTTVHGAKGLEWPVVVAVGLEQRLERPHREGLVVHPELGLAWNDREAPDASGLTLRIAARRRAEEDDEANRLAYVALTRARDALIVVLDGTKDSQLRESLAGTPGVAWHTLEVEATPDAQFGPLPLVPPVPSDPGLPSESSSAPRAPRPRTVAGLAAALTCPWLSLWCGSQGADAFRIDRSRRAEVPQRIAQLLGVASARLLNSTVEHVGDTLALSYVDVDEDRIAIPVRNAALVAPEGNAVAALGAWFLGRRLGVLVDLARGNLSIVERREPSSVSSLAPPCHACRYQRRCPGASRRSVSPTGFTAQATTA